MVMPFHDRNIEVLTVCATIVYGSDMEKTDDVVNRNTAGAGTPHSRGSPARQRQRPGTQLEYFPSGAQPSPMVSLSRESPAAPAHRRDLCASRSQRGPGDRRNAGAALGQQDRASGAITAIVRSRSESGQ